MAIHQANHARILALRSQVSALNASISSTITTLADARTDIVNQKITPITEHSRQVPYKVLLDYAAKISQYTAPKDRRTTARPKTGTEEAIAPVNGAEESTQQESQATQDAPKEGGQPVAEAAGKTAFVPWPSEGIIKQGALGRIQAIMESGQDPARVGLEEPKVEQTVKDEEMVTAPPEPVRAQEAEPQELRTEQKSKIFEGLDLYDPEDEQ